MIAQRAYLELYPDANISDYEFFLKYSDKFNDYNANIKRRGRRLELNLSRRWENINEDVRIGLIQILLNKIFKTKVQTTNMDLYELFLKKVHLAVSKTKSDPYLSDSFDRVNEKYFYGTMEKPNLVWGRESYRKLGSYEYGSDTIMMSKILEKADPAILDYIMYHEMLHKKHKFHSTNGRSFHHTMEFKKNERRFENFQLIERQLHRFLREIKFKRRFSLKARNSK